MAARQTLLWRRVLAIGGVARGERDLLEAAFATIDRATNYAVPNSLFAAFTSNETGWQLHDVFGSRHPHLAQGQQESSPQLLRRTVGRDRNNFEA